MEESSDDSDLQHYPHLLDFVPGELWALNVGTSFFWDDTISNTKQLSYGSLAGSSIAAETPATKATADAWRRVMSSQPTNNWERSSSPEDVEVDPRRLKRQVQNRIA